MLAKAGPAVAGATAGIAMFPTKTWRKGVASWFASFFSAFYLAPWAADTLLETPPESAIAGLGFLLGVGAMKLVPAVIDKLENKVKEK